MAKNIWWSKTAALVLCVTLSTFGFSGTVKAASVIFDYGLIADGGSSFGKINNPETDEGPDKDKGEGNWNIVVPLFNNSTSNKLVIDGIGVTAQGFLGTTETNAFLDAGYGGLGVCSSPSCTTRSNVPGRDTSDDNVSGTTGDNAQDESLKLVYDTTVTYEIDQFYFKNANHGDLTGSLLINDLYTVVVTNGSLDLDASGFTEAESLAFQASLTQTTMTVFKYIGSQFYLTSATVFDSSSVVTTIPLPASLPLLGGVLGLFGLISWRRQRLTSL